MLPIVQTKIGNNPQSAFTVPATLPASGTSLRVEVNGNPVAFTRTSATVITLRNAARGGSLVNFFQSEMPESAGLVWVGTLDFPSITAATASDLTVAVQGAELGDLVALGLPSSAAANLIFQAFVSTANVVTVRASNITAAPMDQASLSFRLKVKKT